MVPPTADKGVSLLLGIIILTFITAAVVLWGGPCTRENAMIPILTSIIGLVAKGEASKAIVRRSGSGRLHHRLRSSMGSRLEPSSAGFGPSAGIGTSFDQLGMICRRVAGLWPIITGRLWASIGSPKNAEHRRLARP